MFFIEKLEALIAKFHIFGRCTFVVVHIYIFHLILTCLMLICLGMDYFQLYSFPVYDFQSDLT